MIKPLSTKALLALLTVCVAAFTVLALLPTGEGGSDFLGRPRLAIGHRQAAEPSPQPDAAAVSYAVSEIMPDRSGAVPGRHLNSNTPSSSSSNSPFDPPTGSTLIREKSNRPGSISGGSVSGSVGRLAIIIDDIGHNLNMPRRFLALGLPLTFSILPHLGKSQASAAMIRQSGREFLIHLPMEPKGYPRVDPGPTPLLLAQDMAATRGIVRGYFRALPEAIGASNHMGSAYSYDRNKMEAVQGVVAQAGRVFLNSLTSPSRIPRNIARRQGYRYLERNIFLDNRRDRGAILRQLIRAERIARRRGRAIAVGHPYPETVRVLRERYGAVGQAPVRLVSLSALLR